MADYGIDQLGLRKHLQIIISARTANTPTDPNLIDVWLKRLVDAIDMKVLLGPIVTYCNVKGNAGVTGLVAIETSHIAYHSWHEITPGLVEVDIFSCKDFDPNIVIGLLAEFDPIDINFQFIDRTHGLEPQKLYVVYQTTNKENGKVYVGVHGDFNSRYRYRGSGKALLAAIKKYGYENFSHQILKLFVNEEDAYEYEKQIVNEEFVARNDTYNLRIGGSHFCGSNEAKEKIGLANKDRPIRCVWVTNGDESLYVLPDEAAVLLRKGWRRGRIIDNETKVKMSLAGKGKESHRKGKTGIVSEETKQKTSQSMKAKFESGYQVWNKGKSN